MWVVQKPCLANCMPVSGTTPRGEGITDMAKLKYYRDERDRHPALEAASVSFEAARFRPLRPILLRRTARAEGCQTIFRTGSLEGLREDKLMR